MTSEPGLTDVMPTPTVQTDAERRLVFVHSAADLEPPDGQTDYVVLDTSWTPQPGERADAVSLRTALAPVLERVNFFDEALDRLDSWAAGAGIAGRFSIEGVPWWPTLRTRLRWAMHELLLWCHTLAEIAPPGRYGIIQVPEDRRLLVIAARANEAADAPRIVEVTGRSTEAIRSHRKRTPRRSPAGRDGTRSPNAQVRSSVPRFLRGMRRRLLAIVDPGRAARGRAGRRAATHRRREQALQRVIDDFRLRPGHVLSVTAGRAFQAVERDGEVRYVDPNLALPLERLNQEGTPTLSVAVSLDHRRRAHWREITREANVLPQTMVRRHWGREDDPPIIDVGLPVEGADRVPLEILGFNLGPTIWSMVDTSSRVFLPRWLEGQRLAERLMTDLRPGVLFIDRERSRAPWLAAARRLGIPIVSVQHGVIYPGTPEYWHPPQDASLVPDVTCVFGTYERDVLVEGGLFDEGMIRVTGSPRADPFAANIPTSPDEASVVRRDLGVAAGDRMLVVSVGNNPIGGDIHSVDMVARLLDGPLPGVHVVIKVHPLEPAEGPYRNLLEGLARAGGYDPPRLSVVRDYDLYRLLRTADAHLGQYSTVLTDAVAAGTPNLMAVDSAFVDRLGYESAGVAVPVRSVDDVRAFMADPVPLSAGDRAAFLDAHYQGGDAAGRIASVIRSVMASGREGA